ncbi:hypothetical protein ACFT1B_35180 [Streptomyces griseoincarnatus]
MDHNEQYGFAQELLIAAVIDGDANTTGVTDDMRERLWVTQHGTLVVTGP